MVFMASSIPTKAMEEKKDKKDPEGEILKDKDGKLYLRIKRKAEFKKEAKKEEKKNKKK